jgi:catechol 2,3-dioxygenase-like lactoylglutathione lyase family enzyme
MQPRAPDGLQAGRRGHTDDTEAAAERLREAGVEQLTAPRAMPWGEQLAFFADPDGNLIHVTSVID